jgi:uncharacterized protein (TIGR04255 family)
MELKEFLIPIKGQHSIGEAVFTLFLAQPILRPERYSSFKELKDKFHQFNNTVNIGIELNQNQKNLTLKGSEKSINGFRFNSFLEGKLDWILIGNNNTATINIHALNYDRWQGFKEKILEYIRLIEQYDKSLFVRGVGLTYIDRFTLTDKQLLKCETIFNQNNKYIPSLIFDNDSMWNTNVNISRNNIIENINVLIKENNQDIDLNVIHNVAFNLDTELTLEDFCSSQIENLSDRLHVYNKEFLKNIFKEEVQKIINLL